MAGWMGTGYKTTEEINEGLPERRNKGPRRVWIPQGQTQRYMFLDTDPQTCWEHKFKWDGSWANWEPCIFRNKLPDWEKGCPMCRLREKNEDAPMQWPSYTGFYTAMQMTPWFSEKGHSEMNYRRSIYACLRGSDENPGTFRELEKLAQKHGRLAGLVFDIERRAKKDEACGTRFELVEKIDPKDIKAYGRKLVEELAARENKKRPADKQLDVAKMLEWNPWEPLDFEKVLKPRSWSELDKMFPAPEHKTKRSKKGDDDDDAGSSKSKGGSKGSEDRDEDDDIPY